MITADSAGITEAQTLVPGTVGISVKESLWHSGGACYSARKTARLIRESAEKLVKYPPCAKPWNVKDPELTVIFNPGAYHDKFKELFNCQDSITITGATVTECWAKYWQMKLETQEAMK